MLEEWVEMLTEAAQREGYEAAIGSDHCKWWKEIHSSCRGCDFEPGCQRAAEIGLGLARAVYSRTLELMQR